jgi:hypothetical protein
MDTFTVNASRDGDWIETHLTSPTLTVAKAKGLSKSGWDVHITDSFGRRYGPARFISTDGHQLGSSSSASERPTGSPKNAESRLAGARKILVNSCVLHLPAAAQGVRWLSGMRQSKWRHLSLARQVTHKQR